MKQGGGDQHKRTGIASSSRCRRGRRGVGVLLTATGVSRRRLGTTHRKVEAIKRWKQGMRK